MAHSFPSSCTPPLICWWWSAELRETPARASGGECGDQKVVVAEISYLLTLHPGLLPQSLVSSLLPHGGKPAWAWTILTVHQWEHALGGIRCEWMLRRGSSPCRSEGIFTQVEQGTHQKVLVRHSNVEELVLMLPKGRQKRDPTPFHSDKVCCSHIMLIIPVVWVWGQSGQMQVGPKSY